MMNDDSMLGPGVHEQLLGEILIDTLGTLRHVNARVLGRKWLDEVFDLCWTSKLARAPEQYGLER